uniref:SIX1_SD domain-containing protein n=1 Tax=Macrostomum lignano TaxID=282301 RepID=A0A1I8JMT5_9PLAT
KNGPQSGPSPPCGFPAASATPAACALPPTPATAAGGPGAPADSDLSGRCSRRLTSCPTPAVWPAFHSSALNRVGRVCQTLEESARCGAGWPGFSGLLPTSPRPVEALSQQEAVIRGRAVVAFHAGNLPERLYQLMEMHQFSKTSHAKLQTMWLEAHYLEAEKLRGAARAGGQVRYPMPRTIWDGEQKTHCFKERTRGLGYGSGTCRTRTPTRPKKRELAHGNWVTPTHGGELVQEPRSETEPLLPRA